MVENPNNPNETRVEFNVGNYGLALEVGFSIEVSGADISKTLTLVDLGDLTVEVKENTVTGGYPEDKTLSLWLDYYGYGQVMIESEAEGAWTVDTSFSFSQPLGPGSQGRFSTQDSDGDVTFIDWTVLTPKIDAWYQYNNIYANGWPEGETVTLHIDDGSEDGIEGGEKLVEPNPWNPSDTQAQFNLNGNTTLEPGMVLTVTDGTTSRSLTILALEVVEVNETSPESNPNRNTVKGTLGIPSDSAGTYLSDQKLWIDFNVDSGNEWCRRLFHAISKDADTGTWTVDYTETGVSPDGQICTTKDIVLGSSGSVMAPDSEENTTSVNWRMANPFIEARVNNKFIRGHDFPLGAMVQLATVVGEGDAEVETIIGNTKKVTEADWDSTQTIVDFDDLVTLTPGLKVRLTDSSEGGVTRDHTILADPGYVVDLVNDTISGTLNSPITAKSVNVNVNFDDINANRCADLEGSGNWSANFNTEPGNNGQGTLKLDAESRGDIWLLDNANCNGGSATVYNWVVRLDLTVNIKYAEGSNSSITNIVTSRVKNLPGSAVCKDPSCKTPHDGGAIISLTPSTKVGSGYAFQNWTGCDAVIGKACTVKLNAAKEVTATFTNAYLLTVTKTGNGTISAKNIYCGTDCSQPYLFNTKVTVSATADTGYTFTSWGGACSGSGSCEVAMTAAKSVSAVFAINTYKLTVTQNTDAGGTISRSPTGTDCGAGCQKYSYNTKVTLTAAPKTGWGLGGWSGACSGKNSCIVYVTSDKSVNADFFQLYGLTVNMAGTGKGSITRSAQPPYDASQTVTLTAVPTTGSTFTGWSGACGSISNNVCTVATNAAKTVTATFEVSKFGLTITKVGTGTVTGTGINCGTDCKETYNYNTAITIKAVPATGWTFAGWSGGGCSGKSITCWVKMTETRVVKATFAKKAITPKNR